LTIKKEEFHSTAFAIHELKPFILWLCLCCRGFSKDHWNLRDTGHCS